LVELREALEIEESLRLYYQQELERITNQQQSQKSSEKNMPHVIAIGTLAATALGLTAAFPPAGIAFGFLVFGAGLVARD
jgi:pseudouridine-5'-phosphate glycosidase